VVILIILFFIIIFIMSLHGYIVFNGNNIDYIVEGVGSKMSKYKGLFTLDEWRKQILPSIVKECRIELLRARRLGKKGARVDRNALLNCVREKAKAIKEQRLAQIAGSV